MTKRWRFRNADPALAGRLAGVLGMSAAAGKVLAARGLDSPQKARAFLESSLDSCHSPWLLSGMREGVARVLEALRSRQRITVFGDYDVDGVTSTALLLKLFKLLGAEAGFYIPDRIKEGYGPSIPALERLRAQGSSLVITVDCGVSALPEAAAAKAAGLDLIITDHHVPGPLLPDCLALINPKTSPDYPYSMLGGVGVAWKFAQAVLEELKEPRAAEFLDNMLELVALGTVCDVAPLDGENRALVREGILRLRQGRWMGLRALAKAAGLESSSIDPGSIGFALGPRLNAGGRVGDAALGVQLLLSKDPDECRALAARLNEENTRRQSIEKEVVSAALALAEVRVKLGERFLVLWAEGWHPGVVGLAASRVQERYSRPALVFSVENGTAKGSARSRRPLNVVEALRSCEDCLTKYGGHEFAAGATLPSQRLEELRERLNRAADAVLNDDDLKPELDLDAWVEFPEIDARLMDEFKAMQPFGLKNPRPLLAARACRVLPGSRPVGSSGEHLKLSLRQGAFTMPGIAFRQASLLESMPPGSVVDAAFHPEWNLYQGVRSLQLEVKDLRLSEGEA